MLIFNKELSVSPITTYSINEVTQKLKKNYYKKNKKYSPIL